MFKLEVFFDYECPFCIRGHQNLMELLADYPQIEAVWCPCEAHPRPEQHGLHSDLLIQGMFFAADSGIDILKYHDRAYSLYHKNPVNVEDIDVLTEAFADMLDAGAFREALENGKFRKTQEDGNDYAYEKSGVWVVPAYRIDGKKLDSVAGVGVPKEKLKAFLDGAEKL